MSPPTLFFLVVLAILVPLHFLFFLFFFNYFFNFYFERERVPVGEGQREGEFEAGSALSAQSSGLKPTYHEIMT